MNEDQARILRDLQPRFRYCLTHDDYEARCRFCRSGVFENLRRGLSPDPESKLDEVLVKVVADDWRGLLLAALDEVRTLNDLIGGVER